MPNFYYQKVDKTAGDLEVRLSEAAGRKCIFHAAAVSSYFVLAAGLLSPPIVLLNYERSC